jgi:tetratricopeptide (TPR) repeat protein
MALTSWPVAAHDSPGDVIHALSHRMELEGPTARLLAARAFEYQALGQWEAAIADFNGALTLQPRFGAALQGLAAVELRASNPVAAESAARRAVDLYDDPTRRAPGEALLAQVLVAQSRWPEALDAWRRALKSPSPEVDWYLGEAECLGRMKRFTEQSEALAAARLRNPSVVLHRAWVRALVESGRLDEASREIEAGLANTRWRSTWLLLRARLHEKQGDTARQHDDALAALAELQGRINPERPDHWLLAECGIALALAGRESAAREYEKQARELGVPDADLLEIDAILTGAAATAP